MKAAKTSKNLKEMPYPPQKKLLKRKGNSITLESQIIGEVGRAGGGWNKDVLGGKKSKS